MRTMVSAIVACIIITSIPVCAQIEDGQSYWRRVIRQTYGVEAPSNLTVPQLIELQRSLLNTAGTTTSGSVLSTRPRSSFVSGLSLGVSTSRTDSVLSSETKSKYLGRLSSNVYDPESLSNPYGRYGSEYGDTLKNRYSPYGSPYSPTSPANPYAIDTPRIYAADGTYLGKLSSNKYDPESISNPYGKYGNPYGNNLMNPYSKYGSKYSPESWTNPYAYQAPKVYSAPLTGLCDR